MARKLYNGLFFVIITLALTISARAAAQTTDIFYIEDISNMAVTIYYDAEPPDVSFIAPDGTPVDAAALDFAAGDMVVCYYIPDAMAGQWQMSYDKRSNAALDISWSPYANAVTVTQLSFVRTGEHSADVTFEVTGSVEGQYRYTLYAAITDAFGNVSGKRELTSGTGSLNRAETVRARLDSLQTYDNYRFYLDVWRDDYGLEASDTAVSDETFGVAAANAPEPIADVFTEVDLTEKTITLDWSGYAVRCDEYIVGVFDAANDSEPIYANAFTGDVTQTSISYTAATERIRVELSYIRSGSVSQTLKKDVPIKTDAVFTFPDLDLTSAKQISVAYAVPGSIEAVVAVNENEQQIQLRDDGAFSIGLDDFDNEISIRYRLSDENTVYLLTHRISVDSVAPMLLLPENDVTLFVETDTFDLAGATETGCAVTINGEGVTLNVDGTFVHTLALSDGENEFIVSAADAAGNVASQLIIIYKLQPGAAVNSTAADASTWRTYLPLICAFAASLVLLALVFLFTRLYAKNRGVSSLYALLSLLRDVFLVCLIAGAGVMGYLMSEHSALDSTVKSEKLFEVAQRSVAEAFDMIRKHAQYGKWLGDAVTLTVVAAVLFAGCLFLAIYIKRKGEPGTKPPKPAATRLFVCPSCGETHKEPTTFCIKCGTKMQ